MFVSLAGVQTRPATKPRGKPKQSEQIDPKHNNDNPNNEKPTNEKPKTDKPKDEEKPKNEKPNKDKPKNDKPKPKRHDKDCEPEPNRRKKDEEPPKGQCGFFDSSDSDKYGQSIEGESDDGFRSDE